MAATEKLKFNRLTLEEMQQKADAFVAMMEKRRTVRDFSSEPFPRELLEQAIHVASLAPSGANQQPWKFVVISKPEDKLLLREAAEEEERAFYAGKAGEEWLSALAHLGTDASKPHLTDAPYIVVLFAEKWGFNEKGEKQKHYYVPESVSIAAGFFIAAIHHFGLVTLTHTPAPMGFLNKLCKRPDHEKPMLIFPVGFPVDSCEVPVITKKPLEEVCIWL